MGLTGIKKYTSIWIEMHLIGAEFFLPQGTETCLDETEKCPLIRDIDTFDWD